MSASTIPHKQCKTPSECRRQEICLDAWHCSATVEKETFDLTRTPIMLGEHTVAIITLLHKQYDNFEDIWVREYIDAIKHAEHAASQFINAIKDNSSIAFLKALRKEINKTIKEHDERFGTKFSEG